MKKHTIKTINVLLFLTILVILGLSIRKKVTDLSETETEMATEPSPDLLSDALKAMQEDDIKTAVGKKSQTWAKDVKVSSSEETAEASDASKNAKQLSEEERLSLAGVQNGYYFKQLDQIQKAVYLDMYYALLNRCEVSLSTVNEAGLEEVFQLLLLDHPEVDYSNNFSYVRYSLGAKVTDLVFSPTFLKDAQTVSEEAARAEGELEAILSGISPQASDYEKVKYVTRAIAESVTYDKNVENPNSYVTLLTEKRGTCGGYSALAQILLNRLGVETTTVVGDAKGVRGFEGHAWNLVKVDGEYYHHDVTWCDMEFSESDLAYDTEFTLNYACFLLTTEKIRQDHRIDYENYLPVCVSTMDNYYVREGLYFSDFSPELLAGRVEEKKKEGENGIQFICSDYDVYAQYYNYLFEEQHIFDYTDPFTTSAHYMADNERFLIQIWF